ncbi:uncharacterized protein LOC129293202 [Prosopis cineraria]|uniref:uncharacterized protein LOC129293202 n=1 Tax=Prosopis cineraria TaxID=364024 RepID=UPI002410A839|nr:uncharacterized protein LOC129293202 [Prosopis cineraria]XP_054786992.1 uncharacterized protein LOC129293202 [Prosopis cineraria]XP_054786993.1 uncharacterized protein LOC129293202 [Prosopis cineraria]XP_054786994.1 uncharacterized protein LOC129293202 [Prosopis cineraria]
MASASLKELFCYFHIGGEFVTNAEGKMYYEGGRSNGRVIKEGMTREELIGIITSCMEYQSNGAEMKYTIKFDSNTFLDLEDDEGVAQLIKFNDNCAHVYIVEKANQIIEAPRKSCQGLRRSSENACASSPSSREPEPEALPCAVQSASAPIRRKSSRVLKRSSRNSSASCPPSSHGLELGPIPCTILSASTPMHELNTAQWKDLFMGVGQIFENAITFRQALYKYSIAHKFSYIFVRNSSKKMIVKCKIDGCKWKITAYAMAKTTPLLSVKSFHQEHIHSAQDNLIVPRMARSNLTSSIIMDGIRSSVDKAPNEIRNYLYREYGVSLSYRQAMRGKKRALEEMHGLPEHSFMLIPWMCERLMENDPNTVARWSASTDNRFERLFIAYGCCINGFLLGSRPILYLDRCHLNGPYKLTLLAASTYDANNELFPVAYAIACGETFDEWAWFLHNVKDITSSVQVTVVSDRNSAIIAAVRATFGDERHAYCYRHLKENFSLEVTKIIKGTGKNNGYNKEDALKLLDAIAYARLECDFNVAMGNLRSFCPEMAQWLETNGDIDRWALSRFPFRRWDNIVTNLAESFNLWLVKEINHNVCVLIHEHQEKLAKELYASKEAMIEWKNGVGLNVEAKLKENVLMAEVMEAEYYGPNRILVRTGLTNFSVNLAFRDCTCQAWQMSGIPCTHACAAIKRVHDDVYAYVEECYLLSSQQKIYNSTMIPVEINDMPRLNALALNDDMPQTSLKPPMTTRPPGRPPQSTRRESQFQHKKAYHCSRCQEAGHTRKSCKNLNAC